MRLSFALVHTLPGVPWGFPQSHGASCLSVLTSARWGSLESDRSKHRWSAITARDNGRCVPWESFKGFTQTLEVTGSHIRASRTTVSHWGGHFTAFWCIIMSLAPYRHERINTRKTLIIESCPDDDLVNLEFLDEVRFNMFISSCIDWSRVHPCWCYVCIFMSSAGDNNQPSPEEVRWAAGVHLRRWHPHRSQSLPESQHLLPTGLLWASQTATDVPSSFPITTEVLKGYCPSFVDVQMFYILYILFLSQ